MKQRINYHRLVPDAVKALMTLDTYVQECGLDRRLLDLVRIRASQINGCAYCIYVHVNEARAHGESDDRIHLLAAWSESPLFTERERAALAWTEAVTLISETHVPDQIFEQARQHFSEEELVKLTVAAAAINALNRLAISMRAVHPTRKPVASSAAPAQADAGAGLRESVEA